MSDIVFEEIVKSYADMVYRIALGICRNQMDSEDIMQNVFLRLHRKFSTFSSEEHIKAWLIRVTINESKRLLKHNSKYSCESYEILQNEVFSTDKESQELFGQVMELKEKYRTVLYLYYYEDLSTKEISQMLKIKEATVRTQLARARELLKLKIEEEEYD